jgi:hypothetical protein
MTIRDHTKPNKQNETTSHAPELGEQFHVQALQPKRGIFSKMSAVLVDVDQLVKLIGMHDNVQPADLGKAKLSDSTQA